MSEMMGGPGLWPQALRRQDFRQCCHFSLNASSFSFLHWPDSSNSVHFAASQYTKMAITTNHEGYERRLAVVQQLLQKHGLEVCELDAASSIS